MGENIICLILSLQNTHADLFSLSYRPWWIGLFLQFILNSKCL